MIGWCDYCRTFDQKDCGQADCPEKINGVLPQYSADARELLGIEETITAEEEARHDAQAEYLDSSISKDRPYPPMYI